MITTIFAILPNYFVFQRVILDNFQGQAAFFGKGPDIGRFICQDMWAAGMYSQNITMAKQGRMTKESAVQTAGKGHAKRSGISQKIAQRFRQFFRHAYHVILALTPSWSR